MTVTVRYFAAARAAAGVDTEPVELAQDASVADLLATLRERGGELPRVLDRCSFLLDEVAVRDRTVPVPAGATVDVLPPFAGG
jgi:molybdopterin converting factor small subunit